MGGYIYTDRPKPATEQTRAANRRLAEELGLDPEAPEGLELLLAAAHQIRSAEDVVVRDAEGNVVWDLGRFSFLKEAGPDDRVNPSLWLNGRANLLSGLFEVVPGKIYQVRGFDLANLTLVRSATGWIVLDCMTNVETARAAMAFAEETLGEEISARVRAVIISHSHLDHYGGVCGVTDPARLGTEVPVYVPAGYDTEVVREHVYAGHAMARRKKYQVGSHGPNSGERDLVSTGIGLTQPTGHASFVRPTVYIDHDCALELDGLTVEFMLTPEAEAPVEMINYFPAYRALWMAELCNGTLHNLYPIRGAQVRDAAAWSRDLTDALVRWGGRLDVVFQSHNWPHWNTEEEPRAAETFLCNTAAAYRWIHDQTLLLANQGYTPLEIARQVRLPEQLAKCGYLRPYYGSVEVNCRAVYQKYLGFYDGNPVHLNPLTDVEAARRYVAYMGGADAVLERAEADYAAGEYQWVAEVTQRVVFADPSCRRARLLCADAMEQMGYQAESGIWRNAYLTAAAELRAGVSEARLGRGNSAVLEALSPEFLLEELGIVLDGERARNLELRLNLEVTDRDERFRCLLHLHWGALLIYRNGKDPQAESLSVSKEVLTALVDRRLDTVRDQMEERTYRLLHQIETYVTDLTGKPPFPIVEP